VWFSFGHTYSYREHLLQTQDEVLGDLSVGYFSMIDTTDAKLETSDWLKLSRMLLRNNNYRPTLYARLDSVWTILLLFTYIINNLEFNISYAMVAHCLVEESPNVLCYENCQVRTMIYWMILWPASLGIPLWSYLLNFPHFKVDS
jgi:hypothetical protein